MRVHDDGFCRRGPAFLLAVAPVFMHHSYLLPITNSSDRAEALLWYWVRECADSPAVHALTPTTEAGLLTVLQHLLTDTEDLNVDRQDVWAMLAGATALQFGAAASQGPHRAELAGQQLWAHATILGEISLPANQLLLAIQSGTAPVLTIDELTHLTEGVIRQTGEQADVIFGHGVNPLLGESLQVLLMVAWQ